MNNGDSEYDNDDDDDEYDDYDDDDLLVNNYAE